MSLELYLAFCLASAVLILIPGPNVALIVANSVAHGPRYGLLTVAGTTSAAVIQLILTVLGMTTLLTMMADWFDWLRWLGVAYLVYLGVRAWRAMPIDLTKARPEPRSPRNIYLRGFLVSLTNPKTLLFFGAFFPQFIDPTRDYVLQIAVMGATAMVISAISDSLYALASGTAGRALSARRVGLLSRLSGGCLIGGSSTPARSLPSGLAVTASISSGSV